MKMLAFYSKNGMFWVRLFGYGLYIKNTRQQPLSFSERQKLTLTIRLFGYVIGYLKPLNFG